MQQLQFIHNQQRGDSRTHRRIAYKNSFIPSPEKCKPFMLNATVLKSFTAGSFIEAPDRLLKSRLGQPVIIPPSSNMHVLATNGIGREDRLSLKYQVSRAPYRLEWSCSCAKLMLAGRRALWRCWRWGGVTARERWSKRLKRSMADWLVGNQNPLNFNDVRAGRRTF
jgi:hypothetical protein